MTVLVTGGAGYIGSHMVARLVSAGRPVVVVDDLSSGHESDLPPGVPLIVADVGDADAMRAVLRVHGVVDIIHFAARIQVGESVREPRLYWQGNVAATANLLEAALDHGVRSFILSSTAAVYGTPVSVPILETASLAPINPYGETKLTIERMLASYGAAYGLRWAALRYFNAAGADASRGLGERHEPETHLIPLVLDVALGKQPHVAVFGGDYSTPDGTCIRDYIHVQDLADAHLATLDSLASGGASGPMNLGTGVGHSVAEVVAACRAITGREIPMIVGSRRDGDPASLVASPELAHQRLGWRATRSDLRRIVSDAWAARAPSSTPRSVTRSKEPHVNVR